MTPKFRLYDRSANTLSDVRELLFTDEHVLAKVKGSHYLYQIGDDADLLQLTGYQDICEGDIVLDLGGVYGENQRYAIRWGQFEDCCVNGHAWMLYIIGVDGDKAETNRTLGDNYDTVRVMGNEFVQA